MGGWPKGTGGQVGQRPVREVDENVLDDRMRPVGGPGLQHRVRSVGEDRIVAPGGERLALPGGTEQGEALDPTDDQLGGGMPGCAAAGERGERHLGDLGVEDRALALLTSDRRR
jgi:hypothetical protein